MPQVQGLGTGRSLVMDKAHETIRIRGFCMAEEEQILVSPPTQEMAVHVRDYARFTKLMTRGAIACFIIGFFVLLILK